MTTLSACDAAAQEPSRAALVLPSGTSSWPDLAIAAQRASAALLARGVTECSDASVAVVAEWSPDVVAVLLALFELDVPVALLHPRWTAAERARVIAALRPALVVDDGFHVGDARARPRARAGGDRTLAIVFTSGSTGTPRGVALNRRALVASAVASAANLGWRDDDAWLGCMPLAHVGGLSILLRCLLARRTIVATPELRFDSANVAATIERERVTLASLVPTMLDRLLATSWQPPRTLRAVLLGGGPASPSLLARARDRGVPVLRTYGLTEACSQIATDPAAGDPCAAGDGLAPVSGAEIRVVEGIIHVRGPMLAQAYVTPSAAPLPLTPDGFFVTGDRGALDARGRLRVLGRSDDVIVTGGENVDPVEVEQALEACPGVAAACVFAVPDATWGSVVCAAIVSPSDDSPTDGELLRALDERLASFKRPRRIARTTELCTGSSGKLDRRATAATVATALRPLGRGGQVTPDPQ